LEADRVLQVANVQQHSQTNKCYKRSNATLKLRQCIKWTKSKSGTQIHPGQD
jgi:hypothetical protein